MATSLTQLVNWVNENYVYQVISTSTYPYTLKSRDRMLVSTDTILVICYFPRHLCNQFSLRDSLEGCEFIVGFILGFIIY
jgi:hypothetical protein